MNTQNHPRTATAGNTGSADTGSRSVWPSSVALALSMLACYGTLAAVIGLPMLGITLAPDDTLWRTAIVAPAVLVVIVLGLGARRHASWLPAGLAMAGTAMLTVLMFWHMNRMLEALAFALLLAAVLIERRRCAHREPSPCRERGHV